MVFAVFKVTKQTDVQFGDRISPSKNCLARNMPVLEVFFVQDLQNVALNLASLALKMKLFLQDIIILEEPCKKKLQDNFLARFLSNLARK